MPAYYCLVNKTSGDCLGHCLKSSIFDDVVDGVVIPAGKIYKPTEDQEIVIHTDEWLVNGTGKIGQNKKYKWDKQENKIRVKNPEELLK